MERLELKDIVNLPLDIIKGIGNFVLDVTLGEEKEFEYCSTTSPNTRVLTRATCPDDRR